MDLNRNQFFFAGTLILLIGIQLRLVQSYVLTPEATRMMAKQAVAANSGPAPPKLAFAAREPSPLLPAARKVIRPPEWLGWCLLSVGSVLILHSLSMRKPD